MDQTPSINILVVAATLTDADQLINVLRKAGLRLHAEAVRSEESLRASLSRGRWDLLFLFIGTDTLEAGRLQAVLTQSGQDLPCIGLGDLLTIDAQPIPVPEQCIPGSVTGLHTPQQCALLLGTVRRELDNLLARRELRRTRSTLKELEQRYQLLFDSSSDAVAYLQDGLHIHVNPSYARLFGFPDTAALQTVAFLDLVADADVEAVRQYLRQHVQQSPASEGQPPCVFHDRSDKGLSSRLSLEAASTPSASKHNLQIIVRAASGNLAQQHRRSILQSRDLLTGLNDRASLLSHIEDAIARAIYEQQHSTLVLVRLHAFETFTARAGQAEADRLMRDIAQSLSKAAGAEAISARCNEHEFALLLPQGAMPEDERQLQQSLQTALSEHLQTRGFAPDTLQLRFGIAIINELSVDAETVLTQAGHHLMLAAGARGSHQDGETAHARRQLLEQLLQAFDNDGIRLVFQPIVSLEEDGMARYEVRVRLQSRGRLLHPPQFLELAGQHGLGERLDRQVIRQCLQRLQELRNPHLRLSINLTLNSVLSTDFLPWLVQQLHESQQAAGQIVLQLSELDIVSAPEAARLFCSRLRELHIDLSITHFGCTLQAFKYLADFGASCVKLDPALLDAIDTSLQQRDQLAHLVNSLHASGVLVVAPMLEQIDLLPLLWQSGVNFVQGNLLQEASDRMDFSFVQHKTITLDCFH